MAQKTFKAPRHKVAPKAKPAEEAKKIVWSPVKGTTPQLEKIESIVMSIAMFAKAQNMTATQAYRLLIRNAVIEHLDDHYEIESCLPIEHVVSDMEEMCGIGRGGKIP